MKCHEARKFLGPYLDSELDAKTTFEIEQHLQSCAECARVFEAEEKLEAQIGVALRHLPRTSALWMTIESKIKSKDRFGWMRSSSPLKKAALLAVAALSAVLVVLMIWLKPPTLELAAAAEKHHRAYVDQVMLPEFTGPVPKEIVQKLGDRLDAGAFSYVPSRTKFTTEGARLCNLAGVPVAWIFGREHDVPISVLVLKRSELEHFPTTKKRLEAGEPVVCSKAGRFQVAMRLLGDHVICAMGAVPRSELEELVKSVSRQT